jgi:hypothetical protein
VVRILRQFSRRAPRIIELDELLAEFWRGEANVRIADLLSQREARLIAGDAAS